MKKNKKIGYGLLAFLAVTTAIVVPPVLVANFAKLKVDNSKIMNYIKENIKNTDDLEELINSNTLKDDLLNSGIINNDTYDSIESIKVSLSSNNNQIPGNYVNIDIQINYNEKKSNEVENINNISTSILIINFNESLFRSNIAKIQINELNSLLNSTNIIKTIIDMNVGFISDSLTNVSVTKSNSSFGNNFYSLRTSECTYKLDFNFELTKEYVFNYNLLDVGQPDFKNFRNILNVDTIGINVQFDSNQLEKNILGMNNFESVNDILTNPDSLNNLVNNSEIVEENDWIAGNKIQASVSDDGFLQLEITTELINGQSNITGPIKTQVQVVNFNEPEFKKYMLTVINENDLNSQNLDNSLVSSNSNLNNQNLLLGSSIATQLENPVTNSEGNKVYEYNFDIKLNENYCLFDSNLGTISNNIILNNVLTGIATQVEINSSKLENVISSNTTNPNSLNNLLSDNDKLLEIIKESGCVSNPNYINSVSANDITQKGDEFVRIELTITLNSEQSPNPVSIPINTGMKIVTINRENLDSYFSTNVNNNEQINESGLLNSLILSSSNLTIDNLLSASSTLSNPVYEINPNNHLPCDIYDLVVNLKDGYCFYDFDNKNISISNQINDVLTAIVDANIDLNTSGLEDAIKNLDSVESVNNAINNPVDFVKNSGLVDPADLVENVTLTPTVVDGKIQINANIDLSNGQSTTVQSSTNLNVVNFDRPTFIEYIKNIDSNTSLESTQLLTTLANSGSNLTIDNLNNSTTAIQSTDPVSDPDRNDNEYYQYSFNIILNSNYCLFENGVILSQIPNLNNLWTSILSKANVNVDTFKQNVINYATNIDKIQQLLGDNSSEALKIAQDSNIVDDPKLITSVNISDVTSTSDSTVKLQATINYSTNQEPTVVEIDTNVRIINFNQQALIEYFRTSVNSESAINSPISTLENSGSGLVNGCLSSNSIITPTSKVYENDINIPYNAYDINVVLNDGYCFYNFDSKNMFMSQSLSNVMSNIKYNIVPSGNQIQAYIEQNYNTYSKAQELIAMNNQDLINMFNQNSYVIDDLWIKSINVNTTNVGNKIQYNFTINFYNDQTSNLEVLTNIQILNFDRTQFVGYIKTIESSSELVSPNIINTIANSGAGISDATMLSSSTSSEQLPTPGTMNDISGLECYNYNFNIVLSDNYCFYNDSIMSNSVSVDNVLSNVYVPTEIGNNIQNLIDTVENLITIDNYKDYFEGADNNPSDPNISGVQNAGRMTSTKLEQILGLPSGSVVENSVKFVKSSDTDNGYLIVDITFELEKPYAYNGSQQVTLNNVTSSIYDPNSSFNLSLFNSYYDGAQLLSFSSQNIQTIIDNNISILYLPYVCGKAGAFNRQIGNNLPDIVKKIVFSYSCFSPNYESAFDGITVQEIDISGALGWTGSFHSTYGDYNVFANANNLTSATFANCTKLIVLSRAIFYNCPKLSYVDLSGCTSLSIIEGYVFQNCSSLTTIDLSSTTSLTSVDPNAFVDSSIKTIYVANSDMQKIIQDSLTAGNVSGINVIIK